MVRWSAGLVILLMGLAARADDAETFFETRIRPVLGKRCGSCHGPVKSNHGLRVDSREALLRGGESGPAIIPSQANKSLLLAAVRRQGDIHMPPDEALKPAEIADLETWIAQGAFWPARAKAVVDPTGGHWAFQPMKDHPPPADPSGWAAGPIDKFIAAGLRQIGVSPNPPADKRTLLRRLSFDLVGLPPTPEEMDGFLADSTMSAWRTAIDRLLASPQYGERWGRHWLDVARYADTAGDNADYPIPEVHRYRDYVIDSFNADKPYDEFVREQIAGDLLAISGPRGRYAERVVATGFLALSRRYGTMPVELWHLTMEDSIDTVGRAFMGLTLRCARCHDHKFDPVSTKDYYSLYGVFASTRYPYAGSEEFTSKKFPRSGFVPLSPTEEVKPDFEAYQRRLKELAAKLKSFESQPGKKEQAKAAAEELRRLERSGLPPGVSGAYAVWEGTAEDVPIQRQGDPATPGPVVKRGAPAFLPGGGAFKIPSGQSGRRQLAEWLTRPDHPLTARVMVNRVWRHHFGRGIVETPSNFGLRGERPTHPELLDWLALRFVESGWSIKEVHRLILLSKTYQLSSADDEAKSAKDAANDRRWRFDRRRLDAEAIRDSLLAMGGTLDLRRPGPHPFPPMETWGWTQHNPFKTVYETDHRAVYLMTQRIQRHPFLALFDGPDTNASTEARSRSTVPLQSLYWLNNPLPAEQATKFASCVIAHDSSPSERVRWAYERAFGRPPDSAESAAALEFVQRIADELAREKYKRNQGEVEPWSRLCKVLLLSSEFIYID